MNNTLNQGWTPTVKTKAETIWDAITRFEKDKAIILARMEQYENDGHYAENPEDRDILESNLGFARGMIQQLKEDYSEVVKWERDHGRE